MARKVIHVALNGVTGRMGYRQHLVRSLLAIREQGGVRLDDGTTVYPEPVLVGRSEERLRAIAARHGLDRWTTDLDKVLADPEVGDVFRETKIAGMHEHLKALLASELGDDFPDLDLRATAGPAILVYQAAICGQPVDADAMAERLTELLFAPPPQVG